MTPIVAIVGRPNVGKSTLFNRLIGERQALVHDSPGVTRDRHYGVGEGFEREVLFIDTGGFEPVPEDHLFDAIRSQAELAIDEADLVLFVVDQRAGLTPADKMVARILRKRAGALNPLLVINKCDGPRQEQDTLEFYELGLESHICISAEHGRGVGDLWEAIESRLPASSEEEEIDNSGEIRIAVVGRPNIGKSTLVNRMLGEERHVVHDSPGTTMDAIDSRLSTPDRDYVFVDTAGIRRKPRIHDKIEVVAVTRAIKAIERCHVTLLMIDATEGVTEQDARLSSLIVDRGRAVIVLMNRWDEVRKDEERNVKVVNDELAEALPHLTWAPVLYISALTGKGCTHILPRVEKVYAQFDRRITTSPLNDWLERVVSAHAPPLKHNHKVRLNFITQARVRPPSFVIWCNSPDAIKAPYLRYLENRLRESHGFEGTPVRIRIRKKRKPREPK
ncbi:MAG: ribosome biogenesis GTPase Der [Myxococcota bacterium]|nr:ribosome biogenesis GTPase Der [Myxococcota bacterium]